MTFWRIHWYLSHRSFRSTFSTNFILFSLKMSQSTFLIYNVRDWVRLFENFLKLYSKTCINHGFKFLLLAHFTLIYCAICFAACQWTHSTLRVRFFDTQKQEEQQNESREKLWRRTTKSGHILKILTQCSRQIVGWRSNFAAFILIFSLAAGLWLVFVYYKK